MAIWLSWWERGDGVRGAARFAGRRGVGLELGARRVWCSLVLPTPRFPVLSTTLSNVVLFFSGKSRPPAKRRKECSSASRDGLLAVKSGLVERGLAACKTLGILKQSPRQRPRQHRIAARLQQVAQQASFLDCATSFLYIIPRLRAERPRKDRPSKAAVRTLRYSRRHSRHLSLRSSACVSVLLAG